MKCRYCDFVSRKAAKDNDAWDIEAQLLEAHELGHEKEREKIISLLERVGYSATINDKGIIIVRTEKEARR